MQTKTYLIFLIVLDIIMNNFIHFFRGKMVIWPNLTKEGEVPPYLVKKKKTSVFFHLMASLTFYQNIIFLPQPFQIKIIPPPPQNFMYCIYI